jgi:hypothetical protein
LVKKCKDVFGNENTSDLVKNFTVDTTAPSVDDYTVNGNKSITITFNEELDAANPASYAVTRVSDGEEIPFSVSLDDSMTSVVLTFDSPLDDAVYQLSIINYKDVAGNSNSFVLNFTVDTTAPSVDDYTVNGNKSITITFNEELDAANPASYAVTRVSDGEEIPFSVSLDDSKTSVVLTFDSPLDDAVYQLSIINYKDVAGNSNSSVLNFTVNTDAPSVTQIIVNRNESITITFNEELNRTIAANEGTFTVKRLPDGEEIPLSVSIDESGTSVELIFENKLEDYTSYRLIVREPMDTSGNINTSKCIYSFETLEYTPPEIINDPENDQDCCTIPENGDIIIVFSEAMNEAQMTAKSNYQVSLDGGESYKDPGDNDTITKINESTIRIHFEEFKGTTDINPYVKIALIEDLAGNKLESNGEDDAYIVEDIQPENVYFDTVDLIAKNKIKVVFNKKMVNVSGDVLAIESTTPGSIYVTECESSTVNSDGKTEAIFILSTDLTTDAKDEAGTWVAIYTGDDPSAETEWGSKLEPSSYYGMLNDKTPPEIVKIIADEDLAYLQDSSGFVPMGTIGTITIYFSEAIESDLAASTFNADGFTITNKKVSDNRMAVILSVEAMYDTPILTTVTVSGINDICGNALVPDSTGTVTLENTNRLQ